MGDPRSTVIAAAIGAIAGPIASWTLQVCDHEERRKRTAAVAALRFEVASNLVWLANSLETLNYLRDEAWVTMKNNGFVSYLCSPLPFLIANFYNYMHAMNREISGLRDRAHDNQKRITDQSVRFAKEMRAEGEHLLAEFDRLYPKFKMNFNVFDDKLIPRLMTSD